MVATICFSLFFFKPYKDYSTTEISFAAQKVNVPNIEVLPLNGENLKAEINHNAIFCANEVYAQIQLESGRLNSYLTRTANNLLGMRYPYKRQTTAIGIFLPAKNKIILGTRDELMKYRSVNNYAVYASWQECVKDYKLWQEECFKLSDRYLAFLGSNYAEDTNYVSKIKNFRD